jgi:FMN-dependent NADH-azoreductase
VERWDLWADSGLRFGPLEVEAKMSVIGGDEPRGSAAAAWQRLVEVFDRFDAADTYVFGVPMWNGSIPWVLKQWIDTVTQPGLLFRFDPANGYRGLLRDKRAAVVYTSSVYHPGAGPSFGTDHHSTYFDSWLAFAGIKDVRTVRLQPAHPRSADYARREAAATAAARSIGRSMARIRPSADERNLDRGVRRARHSQEPIARTP